MVKTLFHLECLDYRGTGSVIYNYAFYNELILKNQSILAINKNIDYKKNYSFVADHFLYRFEIYIYEDLNDLQTYCEKNDINYFYAIKYGKNDGIYLKPPIRNLLHCVYTTAEPHGGFKYFGVSETIDKTNYLYHIINLHDTDEDLRKELKISEDETVLGRFGGSDTFHMTPEIILQIINTIPKITFIFMPKPLILTNFNHPKVHYLEPTVDPIIKRKFINTCSAMIHCSGLGESFGLAVLEFSYCNKPVITLNGGIFDGKENQQHLKFLKEKVLLYNNQEELFNHIKYIAEGKHKGKNWKVNILDQLTPEKIMEQFKQLLNEEVKITKMIKNYKDFNKLKLAII